MGMICVNEFTAGDATAVPRCVASWAHTQQQVIYGACALAALLLLALAWTAVSARQKRRLRRGELGFSLRLRRWARTSRTAALINRPLQLLVSFGIYGITLSRCQSYDVSDWHYYAVLALYLLALVDDAVRFLAARYKLLYCLSPLTLIEILCIASTLEVGFGPTRLANGVHTRSWLDFSILRPVFILRSYVEIDRHLPRASKGWMMARLGVKMLLMVMVGASAMFFLETLGEMPFFDDNGFAHLYSCDDGSVTRVASSDCSSETWSIMFSFYFTVVTLGTVGYGDNAPKTVLSRLLAIMFIVMGVILFSMEIETLISLYQQRQIGNPPYKPKPESKHVVVVGNPSFAQLSAILRELFHEDHLNGEDAEVLHAVVLGERKAKFAKDLIARLKADPLFAVRVTYVAGDATRAEDLERALARSAEAVFAFPDKLSGDPGEEDAMNIMRVLAAKRYCGPSMRFLVLVLRAENARHMMAAGVDRDDIICENVIKMGSLAQSAQCNGVSTMLANLSTSFSGAPDAAAHESEQSDASDYDAAGLDPSSKRFAVGDSDQEDDAIDRDWLHEYFKGAGKEMYLIQLAKRYGGLTFAQASELIFRETSGSVVLIAVEITISGNDVPDSQEVSLSRVLLNPGKSLVMSAWIQCYVIADDLDQVFNYRICSDTMSILGSNRGSVVPIMNPMVDTFVEPRTPERKEDGGGQDEMRAITAYTALSTPTRPGSSHDRSPEMTKRRTLHSTAGIHALMLDSSLERVALGARTLNRTLFKENPYEHLTASAEYRGLRPKSMSVASDVAHTLEPPPLSVLLNPDHVVVCSFLGEESLTSLQWLLLPLRAAHAPKHPPVTILHAGEPSQAFILAVSPFQDVYYVRGSPLVYLDLQRAGAKAAAAVVVLGKRSSSTGTLTEADADMDASVVDAEAIFATMLVELKMDFAKMFTITELADEKNSKFLGMSFQLSPFDLRRECDRGEKGTATASSSSGDAFEVIKLWDCMLQNDVPQQVSQQEIFGLPLYMSGRLLHPEVCENMVVQTFFNPSIHRIVRQLVGGPNCSGVIHSFSLPKTFRARGCSYSDVFHSFVASSFSGVCLGLYRDSRQQMPSGAAVDLPIAITTPDADLEILDTDRILVLIGTHTLERAASSIQRFYRRYRRRDSQREPSFGFHRSTISKYLGTDEDLSPPVQAVHQRQAQHSGSTTFYV